LNSSPVEPRLDPRFQTSIGEPGDTIKLNGRHGDRWYEMDFVNLATNTISRKYECSPYEYWKKKTNDNEGPMNLRQIRYSDVILMAAEAAYKTSDEPTARNYVNMVRTRARMSGDTGYPEDLTGPITFEDIVHERRLELAMEGHRFFDLIRWGLADEFISNTTLDVYPGFTVYFEVGKHEFFPIPLTEIQLSAGALEQYPPWQ